ncbi:MAG: SHOCT domain-containing protein [Oscillospiraceae bacterium]|nr:SHOCT domain-containing protein [Oscillospiraceae bacterium]
MNTTFYPQHSLHGRKPTDTISMVNTLYKNKTKKGVELLKKADIEAILIGNNNYKFSSHNLSANKSELIHCETKGLFISTLNTYYYSDISSANINDDGKIELKFIDMKSVIFDFGDEYYEIKQMVDFLGFKINKTKINNADSVEARLSNQADELKKFKLLLGEGVISPEEFNKKKEQLLQMNYSNLNNGEQIKHKYEIENEKQSNLFSIDDPAILCFWLIGVAAVVLWFIITIIKSLFVS